MNHRYTCRYKAQIKNHDNGSKSPQSSFESCFVVPGVGHICCGGLDGAKMPPDNGGT